MARYNLAYEDIMNSARKSLERLKTPYMDHLKENLGSVGWTMKKDDVEALRNGFPGQQDVSDSVHLIG